LGFLSTLPLTKFKTLSKVLHNEKQIFILFSRALALIPIAIGTASFWGSPNSYREPQKDTVDKRDTSASELAKQTAPENFAVNIENKKATSE
jgi:hypothetical protein